MLYSDTDLLEKISSNLSAFRADLKPETKLKRASVSIVVTPNEEGEAAIIMTRRAAKLNSHARQWALPGGRVDHGETAEQAALREVDEELGLHLAMDHLIGRLDDYETRSGYVMQPFVFWRDADQELSPNPDEVSSIHFFQLSGFDRPDLTEKLKGPEADRPILRINVREGARQRQINAPTAAILYQFWEVAVQGRHTRVAHYDQPKFAWK